jgi:ADP-ribosyl-[dinitrogen reductase] hydrolase
MTDKIQLPDPGTLLNAVVQSVASAGAILRAEFHRPGGPRGTGSKAVVDAEVEAFLREKLLSLHDCDWHGEELARHHSGHPDCWVVDPHDGTSAFLKGLRGSAISVALVRKGRPILAVVFAPTAPTDSGDMFFWADGLPPARNGVLMQAIGPRPAPYEPVEGLPWPPVGAEPRDYDHEVTIALNEQAGDFAAHNHAVFQPAAIRALPSVAYRLALAAAGEVEVAISLTQGLDSYDIAGGHGLLTAVGGTIMQLDGKAIVHGPANLFAGCIGGRPELVDVARARRPSAGKRNARYPCRPKHRMAATGPLLWGQGALVGLLVGDALGSKVEFLDPATILARHPTGLRDLHPGGTWNLLAGQPTDDGEVALALARSIVEVGGFDAARVGAAYVAWGASDPFDVGLTTNAGLDALQGRGRPNGASQANGALMRVAPIGIACAGDPEKAAVWARNDAALTHPHPLCLAASAAFCAAIAAGVAGADNRAMWSVAHAFAGDDAGGVEIRASLIEAREALPPSFTRNQGWVLTAFGNAFHRLWAGQGLEDALVETVMLGGDTDTNAAICGALLGAAWGISAIPSRWVNRVLGCRAVKGLGVRHPRPNAYWADDALELAEALLTSRLM